MLGVNKLITFCRKWEAFSLIMVLPTFLLHFLPLLDLGVTIGRKITKGIEFQVEVVDTEQARNGDIKYMYVY